MKGLLIIFVFWQATAFVQENPWTNKNSENPWGTETTEIVKAEKKEIIDSVTRQIEIVDTVNRIATKAEIAQIKDAASLNYKAGGDFAVGLTSGLFLNFLGIFVDGIYTIPTSKKEEVVVEQIKQDSTYQNIKPKIIESKAKNSIKGKKFGAAIAGTLTGSILQILILIGITIA